MTEKSVENTAGKYLGAPVGAALTAVLSWATVGSTGVLTPALVSLSTVLGGICGLALTLVYRRYLALLGANRRVATERQAYDGLRAALAEGNLAAHLYRERLTRFLNWIDGFFADAGLAHRTLFPHAFGLETPVPLWTAPALDRCLLLALFYPIGTLFLIWAVSGHVGPAEVSLHVSSNLPAWQRAAAVIGVGCVLLIAWWRPRRRSWSAFFWGLFGLLGAYAIAYAGGAGVIVSAAAVLFMIIIGGVGSVGSGVGAVFSAVFLSLSFAVPGIQVGGIVSALEILAALTLAFMAIAQLEQLAIKRGWLGTFISTFSALAILICLSAAWLLSPTKVWETCGPMLLFLVLLTLLNAPFDWFSLGLTRALLRRGLELGGWWPYALALVDACLAPVIIAALALTMVLGVQGFDALALHRGGTAVLPLEPLFNGIAKYPGAPEYWWLYALLLSTMIPSLINLVIGGASLVRGLPGLPSLLLRKIPERGGVLKWDRAWIATVLTAQVAAGAALGIAAQVLLVWVIIGHVMPFFGLELLGMAQDVAGLNLPARVGQLFGVNL